MHYQSLSDERLIALLRESNERAFDELFNRYWEKLYAIAYKRLQSKETTEELLQDLFATLWLNRKKHAIHTSLSAWLATSVKYMVLRCLQKELRSNGYRQKIQAAAPVHDRSTEEMIVLHDLQNSMEKALNKLPAKCRIVFEMSRYKHYSTKEIAAELDISEKTVENHIGKALKILRVNLKDYLILALLLFMSAS